MLEILPQLTLNSLIIGSMYALASAGLALNYGILRILNFAHGHLLMLGGYLFYTFFAVLNWSPLAALFATLGCSVVVALLTLGLFVRPFLRLHPLLPLVSTLALSIILESLVSIAWGVNVRALSLDSSMRSYELGTGNFAAYITTVQIVIIGSALILISAVAFFVHSTAFGRRVRALSNHGRAAQATGVNETVVLRTVFILATLITAFAGVLIGFETNLQPTMGSAYTVKAFAVLILGGMGNIWGAIAASYLLGFLENFSVGLDFGGYSLPAGYKDAFALIFILLILLFRPEGLLRKKNREV